MIEARGIRKRFGNVEVLKGIDLSIGRGLVTSIVGPSGAGKTTLLQILGSLARPDAGKVVYMTKRDNDLHDVSGLCDKQSNGIFDNPENENSETSLLSQDLMSESRGNPLLRQIDLSCGTDIFRMTDKALSSFRNKHIGFVFQMHRLLPEFTIEENVALPALIGGRGKRESFEAARCLLKELGLGHRINHKPSELSGGECQRGAVARALINNPSVILADEPSGSLDLANRAELHRLFFDLKESKGVTFVIVTHDETLAEQSDVTISLVDGTVSQIKRKDNEITVANKSQSDEILCKRELLTATR